MVSFKSLQSTFVNESIYIHGFIRVFTIYLRKPVCLHSWFRRSLIIVVTIYILKGVYLHSWSGQIIYNLPTKRSLLTFMVSCESLQFTYVKLIIYMCGLIGIITIYIIVLTIYFYKGVWLYSESVHYTYVNEFIYIHDFIGVFTIYLLKEVCLHSWCHQSFYHIPT